GRGLGAGFTQVGDLGDDGHRNRVTRRLRPGQQRRRAGEHLPQRNRRPPLVMTATPVPASHRTFTVTIASAAPTTRYSPPPRPAPPTLPPPPRRPPTADPLRRRCPVPGDLS